MKTVDQVLNYTNARLVEWYKNVELDYGVIGEAKCTYNSETNKLTIETIEGGNKMMFTQEFYPQLDMDYTFNCWSEDPEQQN